MIAQRQAISSRLEQLSGGGLGNAEPRRRVFRVDNDKLEAEATPKVRQPHRQAGTPRTTHDISEKRYAHYLPSRTRDNRTR
jgi:hypothetical protein